MTKQSKVDAQTGRDMSEADTLEEQREADRDLAEALDRSERKRLAQRAALEAPLGLWARIRRFINGR